MSLTYTYIFKETRLDSYYILVLYVLIFSLTLVTLTNVAVALSDSTNGKAPPPIVVEKVEKGIKVGGMPYFVSMNPKINTVYIADKFSKRITFMDGNSGKIIRKVNLTSTWHIYGYK